jgi:hypothetical protein
MDTRSMSKYTLSTKVNDSSIQISCKQDPRFWFRMCPTTIQNVTDFNLGAFPPDVGGLLLRRCFDIVDRTELPKPGDMWGMESARPPPVIIFSGLSGSNAVEGSKVYEAFTNEALAPGGHKIVHTYLNARIDKRDLYLITDPLSFLG